MRRGTTPKHKFTVPIDLTSAAEIYITYKQANIVKVEKTKDDMTVTEELITLELTQEETLMFSAFENVEIQCRARYPDGTAVASNIHNVPVGRILKEGLI